MTDETPTHAPRKPRKRTRQRPRNAPSGAAPDAPANAATPAQAAPRAVATVPIHVRWHDLDAFNHVNNASFLILLEEARLQWLRTVPGEWFTEHAMPVMAAIELKYLRPITWPAEVDVLLTCTRLGRTSVTLGNRVVDRGDPATVYADGSIVMVWIDPASGKPVALPEAIRKACSPQAAA